MLYRGKQFMWAIKSNFEKIDDDFITQYLNKEEIKLFSKLNTGEQQHSIRVAKYAMKLVNERNIDLDINTVAKAALLHDIGKQGYHLNVIEKSILVLLHKATGGRMKNYSNIKAIDSYYNHSKKGFDILKDYNYSDEFLEAIQRHHSSRKTNNVLLELIRESDNKN